MAELFAPISDGKVVETTSSTSKEDKEKKANDGLDKDAFLQLLVAEMQYQDPLEPTTNTEYISQFATFSQLEATQNVELSNKISMANDLVGKQVIMKTRNDSGVMQYEDGKVDYAYLENGKVYLSVNGSLFNIDDLDSVIEGEYLDAVNLAKMMDTVVGKLPSAASVTLADEEKVAQARELYDSLTDYQKKYLSSDTLTKLDEVGTALAALKKSAEPADE
ncbi:MAG: flagellar hook capping protein [Lachnospiraceae bacterium]|nr:flagellar hook capping protein [Lachnospiraceae bacterium]